MLYWLLWQVLAGAWWHSYVHTSSAQSDATACAHHCKQQRSSYNYTAFHFHEAQSACRWGKNRNSVESCKFTHSEFADVLR